MSPKTPVPNRDLYVDKHANVTTQADDEDTGARELDDQPIGRRDIRARLDHLEESCSEIKVDVAYIKGKVDTMVGDAEARKETALADAKARVELGNQKKSVWLAFFGIILPSIAAIGALLTALLK